MRVPIFVPVLVVIVATVLILPAVTSDDVDAGASKKIEFTTTLVSSPDPGRGHETHHLALVLPPNPGTIYVGTLTYAASAPVQLMILHEIAGTDSRGQPTWTVDGESVYGMTLLDSGGSGSFEFAGAAVALHSPDPEEFVATASIDAWVRGKPTEVRPQVLTVESPERRLEIAREKVPAEIPLHKGLHDGEDVYYIITDSSDEELAEDISKRQEWEVRVSPLLSNVTSDPTEFIYIFENGLRGNGTAGFQADILTSTPESEQNYEALRGVKNVSWRPGQHERLLESIRDIIDAESDGEIEITKTKTLLNVPQVIWKDGGLDIDASALNATGYPEAQLLAVDTENMTATFVAYRAWAESGSTFYHIIADATPRGPAEKMGVLYSPANSEIPRDALPHLYYAQNGILGGGPAGFQPPVASNSPDGEDYLPFWRIRLVEWHDEDNATLLGTASDIDAMLAEDLISVMPSRPVGMEHVINAPVVDPFQHYGNP